LEGRSDHSLEHFVVQVNGRDYASDEHVDGAEHGENENTNGQSSEDVDSRVGDHVIHPPSDF
jgi:hypothetical protein